MPFSVLTTPRLRSIRLLRERIVEPNTYPLNLPVFRDFTEICLDRRLVFFIGENGSGKSTLLEAIARSYGFGAEGGSRNIRRETTGANASVSPLADALRLSWGLKLKAGYFLRAESFFNIATYIDELPNGTKSYGGKSLHKRSHGESFWALVEHRLGRGGFYLMDEPEAALSYQRQLSLLVWVHDMLAGDRDTQFIIATHSPLLLAFPDARILSFDDGVIHEVRLEDTAIYATYRAVLSDPPGFMHRLLHSNEGE